MVVPVLRGYVSSVFTITERRDMALYGVPLFMSLGLGMGTMLANFHMLGIMLVQVSI